MVSERLQRKIARDFGDDSVDAVVARLEVLNLANADLQDPERIQAAVVLLAKGDMSKLDSSARMAEVDWRDVLVFSGLGNLDWPTRLDAALAD